MSCSRAIKTNQDLLPTTSVIGLFYNDFWGTPLTHSGSHKSYRPLCVLSFRLNYYLGEFEPWGYHLGNVLLHALVTGIFTHLSRIFLKYTFPTFVAGLLFASHPVHTESVAGVVGRADVGACLFFLISLLCYMKYCKFRDKAGLDGGDDHWRWFYLSAALFSAACSMLTKEHGITVLAVCASYDILVHFKLRPKDVITVIFEVRSFFFFKYFFHFFGVGWGGGISLSLSPHLFKGRHFKREGPHGVFWKFKKPMEHFMVPQFTFGATISHVAVPL